MRTDSTAIAGVAMGEAREVIGERYGPTFTMPKGRVYKTKSKGAQEAHESIRPTSFRRDPDSLAGSLKPEELRLYRLIWQRALASQMAPKELETTTIELADGALRAARLGDQGPVRRLRPRLHRGSRRRRGRRRRGDRARCPRSAEGDRTSVDDVTPTQHFTEPPPRFTEATLIKALEEHGIGRPSTYAATISTITDRGYVRVEERRLHPEPVAEIVTDLLVEHFGDYVDVEFTARMEEELDEIARGERAWVPLLRAFYGPLRDRVDEKRRRAQAQRLHDRGDRRGLLARATRWSSGSVATAGSWPARCIRSTRRPGRSRATSRRPRRGPARSARSAARARSSARRGRFGPFVGCSRYPDCDYIKKDGPPPPDPLPFEVICPKNKDGHLVPRRARRTGNVFWGCSNYPRCDFTTNHEPLGGLHDTDDGPLARKGEAALCLICGSTSDTPRGRHRPGRSVRRRPAEPRGARTPGTCPRWPAGWRRDEDRRSPARRRPVRRPLDDADARARSSRPPTRERGSAGDRDRSRPRAVPPLARRARRLAAHPARLRDGRRRLPRLAGGARHGLAAPDARRPAGLPRRPR